MHLFPSPLHDLIHPLLGNSEYLCQAAQRLALLMPAADFSIAFVFRRGKARDRGCMLSNFLGQKPSKLPPPEAVALGEMHLEGALMPRYSSSNKRC